MNVSEEGNEMSPIRKVLVVLIAMLMLLPSVPATGSKSETSVEQGGNAQTGLQNIRRQPRPRPNQARPVSSSQTSPDGETGSNAGGLAICDGNIYRSSTPNIRQGGFVPDSWVLGLVDNYDNVNHFSFWVRSNTNGVVIIGDMTDLYNDGGVVAETVLVDNAGTAFGGCAEELLDLGAVYIYNYYWNASPPEAIAAVEVSSSIRDALSGGLVTECVACEVVAPEESESVGSVTPVINAPIIYPGIIYIDSPIDDMTTTGGGDSWWFYGYEGQTITIDLESDDFDSYLTLSDKDGIEIVSNDDRGDGTLHSQIIYTMPYTDYVLINARALNGTSTGSYILYVTEGTTEQEEEEDTAVTTESIVCGGYTTQLVIGGQARRAGGTNVRIRANPSRSGQQLGLINNNTAAAVLDGPQCVDNVPWWQVSFNGVVGWAGEAADGLPLLVPVGSVAPAASNISQPTQPPPQSIIPTPTTVVIVPTQPPPAASGLNYGLSPNFGDIALTTGFTPDPYAVGITSGGNVDVSYLGCVGFATSGPDLRLHYSGGSFPLLRIYFIGNGDTTLIVNDASGGWQCADDSFGTLNPTIDFYSPASGQYDIWVGSYGAGSFVSGTLYITELDSNHP
jgi:hypothetical protein